MSAPRLAAIGLTALACAGLWFAYDNITEIRRTGFWEFRFLLLLCGGFIVLSIVEAVVARLDARGGDKDAP